VSSDHVVLGNGITHTSQSGQQKMAATVSVAGTDPGLGVRREI